MVHPTELLRTESVGEGSFVAPVGDYKNDLDCGFKALPCLTQKLNLEKYAKFGVYVTVLSLVGFFNGVVLKYFRGTAHLWSKHYNITAEKIDHLIYVNEIFVGVFALVVAYWGNRIHRATWLGALTIYLSVCCLTLGVPEIHQPFSGNETDISAITGSVLCSASTFAKLINIQDTFYGFQIVAFVILVVYQMVFALCTVSFFCHGLTYVDDNVSFKHSPGFIGLVLAAQRLGKQVGIYSSWAPYVLTSESIFVSPVWLTIAILTFFLGCIVAMFPKVLPNVLLRKSVISLLSVATGNTMKENVKRHDGFFKSVFQLIRNKILFVNIISLVLMQSAVITFTIFEKFFSQSRYHVSKYNDSSGYSDPTLIQLTTNLLKQPLIAISLLTTGVVIAKVRPRAKYLVCWNIGVFILMALFFASVRFWKCTNELQSELRDRLTIPYCSWNCGCSLDGPFQPVCLNGDTYFSPCLAGCSSFDTTFKIYENCTCGTTGRRIAKAGSCDADSCSTIWAIAQVNSVFSSALLATTTLTSIVITMRCVSSKHKALALGMYLMHLGYVPYLIIRPTYDVIAGSFCQFFGKTSCQFYSESFATFLASATLALMAAAIILSVVLLFLVGNLELYTDTRSKPESDVDFGVLRRTGANAQAIHNPESSNQASPDSEALISRPSDVLLRTKQQSDSGLNTLANRSSKEDRINAYLSEGDLVPPLKSGLVRSTKSTSRTSNSNNSALSTDSSLSAIANNVGDDHDSDFSTLNRPQRVKDLERHLEGENSNGSSHRYQVNRAAPKPPVVNQITETEF
ncbi:solute carrier organic anion transporter family member 2A1-like isoform X2 [Cylas formicarius]|uniref:solute carrier organic anion transporter family member 2A1-like isoform X2 n=1 Tax=Cylas formicarius TaxID=197179 RepID=UPI002958D873|nr:solute carrier organic anion transporter family member 2A1-like isoform X2 [Cylas formicarius]